MFDKNISFAKHTNRTKNTLTSTCPKQSSSTSSAHSSPTSTSTRQSSSASELNYFPTVCLSSRNPRSTTTNLRRHIRPPPRLRLARVRRARIHLPLALRKIRPVRASLRSHLLPRPARRGRPFTPDPRHRSRRQLLPARVQELQSPPRRQSLHRSSPIRRLDRVGLHERRSRARNRVL
jgi:hypothetical protein